MLVHLTRDCIVRFSLLGYSFKLGCVGRIIVCKATTLASGDTVTHIGFCSRLIVKNVGDVGK
jgi:hypothetical protein